MASSHSTKTYRTDRESSHQLEPRVAKLEVGLDRLTEDVRDLAGVVRSQGSQMEGEIQKLVVAVTQAAGPRKTDWSVIISAVLLIMAIGSAVFWPLNQTSSNNKSEIQQLSQEFKNHEKLDNHPVGIALLGRLEEQLKIHVDDNNRQMKLHSDFDDKEFKALDNKLQQEFFLANKAIEQRVADLEKVIQNINDKIYARVTKLEQNGYDVNKEELKELRQWRNKANGLSSPNAVVPLMQR
jgi:hypothetical protein